MKRVLFLLIGLVAFSFAQQRVQTQPRTNDWNKIFVGTAVTTSAVTSEDWGISEIYGAATVWLDTLDGTDTFGDITIGVQIYNAETKEWGTFITGSSAVTITVSGLVWPCYFSLASYPEWQSGDKARLTATAASGSVQLLGWVRGF